MAGTAGDTRRQPSSRRTRHGGDVVEKVKSVGKGKGEDPVRGDRIQAKGQTTFELNTTYAKVETRVMDLSGLSLTFVGS